MSKAYEKTILTVVVIGAENKCFHDSERMQLLRWKLHHKLGFYTTHVQFCRSLVNFLADFFWPVVRKFACMRVWITAATVLDSYKGPRNFRAVECRLNGHPLIHTLNVVYVASVAALRASSVRGGVRRGLAL